jgi:hypothetical protein
LGKRLNSEETALMLPKFLSLCWIVASALTGLALAGSAAAVPISMDPGAVTISGVGNDFTLALDSGDTSDNRLEFSVAGGGGWGFLDSMPSEVLAVVVFHDVSVLSAGELGSPYNNIIDGISIPDMDTVAAILIDRFSPSTASFFVETSATPTIATIYGLNVGDFGDVTCVGDVFGNIVGSTTVRFGTPGSQVPEPTAALVFAVGFLVVQAGCRRR